MWAITLRMLLQNDARRESNGGVIRIPQRRIRVMRILMGNKGLNVFSHSYI